MQGIMTVGDLVDELGSLPREAPVMIAVIKYPAEFALRSKDGGWTWTDSTDVECHPLEAGEITMNDGIIHIAVELNDYDEQRHFAGG